MDFLLDQFTAFRLWIRDVLGGLLGLDLRDRARRAEEALGNAQDDANVLRSRATNLVTELSDMEARWKDDRKARVDLEEQLSSYNAMLTKALKATGDRLYQQAETFSAIIGQIPELKADPKEQRDTIKKLHDEETGRLPWRGPTPSHREDNARKSLS